MKLTKKQTDSLLTEINTLMCANHVPNRGQATFMALNCLFPTVAQNFVNSEINPFFHEEKLGDFMKGILTEEAYAELPPIFKRLEDCFQFHPHNQSISVDK